MRSEILDSTALPLSAPSESAPAIPTNPDALLTRRQTAAALTQAGFQTSPATLASKATRGGGPPYRLFGTRPLYRWGDAIAWAESRLSRPIYSTSELRNVTSGRPEAI